MKKIIIVCSMVILSLFCVGCDKTIELTEEENHLIAEYAAELLLKYDRNYDYKFYDATESEPTTAWEDITEEAVEEDTEEPTEESTQESTEEVSSEDTSTTEAEPVTETEVDVIDEDIVSGEDFDLAIFTQTENVSIKYNYYMLTKTYPSYDQDGMYIEIEAPEGYQLLVLKFNIENLTGDEQYLDLFNKEIDYKIVINDTWAAKQMLTILIDDLYTYQGNISGDGLEEVALLFQVSDDVAEVINNLKLQITYGSSSTTIGLD